MESRDQDHLVARTNAKIVTGSVLLAPFTWTEAGLTGMPYGLVFVGYDGMAGENANSRSSPVMQALRIDRFHTIYTYV